MDTTLAPQPTSNVVFVTDATSTQSASQTPSSPLDVTMLAMLGLTMAGAGVMKSQSAQKKQHELAQANAIAQAQLATAKAEQAQTATANWAENQAMQASATQKVYTKVQQSQANIEFWSAIINWDRDRQRRERERIINLILRTTVTINLISSTGGRADLSLGTVANYNGKQVIVTHDHFTNPRNQRMSLQHIQANYPRIHISGASGSVTLNTSDLDAQYSTIGVMFLSLASGSSFNVTPEEAEIAFNYSPIQYSSYSVRGRSTVNTFSSETCYYSYIHGWNADSVTPFFDNSTNIVTSIQPHSEVLVGTTPLIPLTSLQVRTLWHGEAGRGDSGGGLFNEYGQLIGVFQVSDLRLITLHDLVQNWAFMNDNTPVYDRDYEPVVRTNTFNLIGQVTP